MADSSTLHVVIHKNSILEFGFCVCVFLIHFFFGLISFWGEGTDPDLYSPPLGDKSTGNVCFMCFWVCVYICVLCVCIQFLIFLVETKRTFIWATLKLYQFDPFQMAIFLAARSLA